MSEILCDSSSIIALTTSCLDNVLPFLNKHGIDFIVPSFVKFEMVERPLRIESKPYHMSALKIRRLIETKVLLLVDAKEDPLADEILSYSNSLLKAKGKYIHLVDKGEAAMIAMARRLGIKNILMDERTTRMVIEAPYKLKEHLEAELRTKVDIEESSLREIKDITKEMKVFRSSEMVYLAYKHGFFREWNEAEKEIAEAALYRVKYDGCSIGFDELKEYGDLL
ncbi:MAG: hypothetical protein QW035_04400 [Candidatus Anstonellales archaeon]